jgi:hypothetical protein
LPPWNLSQWRRSVAADRIYLRLLPSRVDLRLHRVKATRRRFERMAEEVTQTRKQDRLAIPKGAIARRPLRRGERQGNSRGCPADGISNPSLGRGLPPLLLAGRSTIRVCGDALSASRHQSRPQEQEDRRRRSDRVRLDTGLAPQLARRSVSVRALATQLHRARRLRPHRLEFAQCFSRN